MAKKVPAMVGEIAGKLAEILESATPPSTRPSGSRHLLPRSGGMYPQDVPQVDLKRAQPRKGKFNERTEALLNSRSAQKKVDTLIDKGNALGMKEWYGTAPLKEAAMQHLSPEEYERFMAHMASASQRNPVDQQNLMGSMLWHMDRTGQLQPNSELLTNKLRSNPDLIKPGSIMTPLPVGYGSLAQSDIFKRAKKIANGQTDKALPETEKLGSFYRNLLGNLRPVTVDVNALRGPVIAHGDPRWLATSVPAGKDEQTGEKLPALKPRQMYESGQLSKADALKRPGLWEVAPEGPEYLALEKLWQKAAKRHGIHPAEAQALGWYGSGDITALKTKPELYIDNLERMIRRTAEVTGQHPLHVLNELIKGNMPLRKAEGGEVEEAHMAVGGLPPHTPSASMLGRQMGMPAMRPGVPVMQPGVARPGVPTIPGMMPNRMPARMADGGAAPQIHQQLQRIPAQLLGTALPGGPVGYQPRTTLLQNAALSEHLKNLVAAMQAEHQAEQSQAQPNRP